MTERTTHTKVDFAQSFEIAGIDGVQPPGTYDVETVEALLDGVSFIAYRRISTTMTLRGSNAATISRQISMIDPADLAAALAKDAEASHGPA